MWLNEGRRDEHLGRPLACAAAALCLTAVLAGCGGTEEWVKPGASETERDGDRAACLNQSYEMMPSAQGPRRAINQERFRRCMGERGYKFKKPGE